MLVVDPYKQVRAFRSRAHTEYITPTGLNPIFKFFLKSRKAKYVYYVAKHPLHSFPDFTSSLKMNSEWIGEVAIYTQWLSTGIK